MKSQSTSNVQLMVELEAWAVKLQQIEARQKQLIGELDTFVHTVAHDLRTSVTLLIGCADILSEEYTKIPAEQAQELLQTIVKTGLQMSNVIDESLSRAESRDWGVPSPPLDMTVIVTAGQEQRRGMIKEYRAN